MKFETLKNLSKEILLENISQRATACVSAHLETAKLLVALDEKREGKGTLKSFVRKETGIEIPDHAFCCAVSFENMVSETPGMGSVDEIDYDRTPLKWHLQVSAICNILNKITDDKPDFTDEERAGVKEQIAAVLRKQPSDGEKQLKAIKSALRGESPEKQETGAGEKEEKEEQEKPTLVLSGDLFRSIGKLLMECQDQNVLEQSKIAISALVDIATGKLEEIAAAPVELEKAA